MVDVCPLLDISMNRIIFFSRDICCFDEFSQNLSVSLSMYEKNLFGRDLHKRKFLLVDYLTF